jgi:hypothetical protein
LETVLRDGPLDTNAVRALGQRIAEGLAAIHAKGIVHRDISPGNIVLPDGKPENAKLIDFGVASVSALETIGMGEFKGKLAYASPEQPGQYGGKVGARSDIHSFGLVLAEAASGAKVYRTLYEMRIPPNVPRELREDILRLLEPDPEVRPGNAFPGAAEGEEGAGGAEATATRRDRWQGSFRFGQVALILLPAMRSQVGTVADARGKYRASGGDDRQRRSTRTARDTRWRLQGKFSRRAEVHVDSAGNIRDGLFAG